MKIVLNGESKDVSSKTLFALLEEYKFSGRVATAVNEIFISSTLRAAHNLKDGDRIEILAPMQGG